MYKFDSSISFFILVDTKTTKSLLGSQTLKRLFLFLFFISILDNFTMVELVDF